MVILKDEREHQHTRLDMRFPCVPRHLRPSLCLVLQLVLRLLNPIMNPIILR